MEKFSAYSDKSTGISPFQPSNLNPTLVTYLFHSIFIFVKAITLLPISLILPLAKLFSSTYKLIIDVILAYFFNVFDTELNIEGVRSSDQKEKDKKGPKIGDIVLTNGLSPLDWFVFKLLAENSKKVKVGVTSQDKISIFNGFSSYAAWCFAGSLKSPEKCTQEISLDNPKDGLDVIMKNGCTLYIIAEGTITNNKGILRFPASLDKLYKACNSSDYGLKTLTLKSTPVGLVNTVVPTSKWWWLFNNFGSMSVKTKYSMKMSVLKERSSTSAYAEISDQLVREKLANNGRLRLLSKDMTVAKKNDYVAAVKESKSKKYV